MKETIIYFLCTSIFKNMKVQALWSSQAPPLTLLRRFAYSEMRLILSRLIYNFDFELCVESQNWIDQEAYFAWKKGPLMVRLSERDSSGEVQIS